MKRRKQAPSREPKKGSRRDLIAALNRALREASGLGAVFSESVARRLGINPTDLECLDVIGGGERVTAGDLANAMGLTSGAVTGVLDRLERAGFARRVRDAGDRRKVFVELTPSALAKAGSFYSSMAREADRLAATYSDAELALLVDYFARSRLIALREIEKLKGRS